MSERLGCTVDLTGVGHMHFLAHSWAVDVSF